MKLIELEPRWIHPNVLAFKCPHCRKVVLTCKNAAMPFTEQYALFAKTFGEDNWNKFVVPCEDGFAWKFSGADFETLNVNPSIDASAAGHWHGHITKGEIK